MKNQINIIMSHGALGASESDDDIETAIRQLALKIEGNDLEWVTKYGTNFENDVFMMHRYCWCEREDCPWCAGCTCPESAWHYSVDGKPVNSEEYHKVFFDTGYEEMSNAEYGSKEHKKLSKIFKEKIKIRNARCGQVKDDVCDYCTHKGIFEKYDGEAPNFIHKKSKFMINWYKYIGRDMEFKNVPENIVNIIQECFDSLDTK